MIRAAVVLAIVAAASTSIYLNRPKPAVVSLVPWCVITERAAAKDELGNWHFGWSEGFGPCFLQDKYREI